MLAIDTTIRRWTAEVWLKILNEQCKHDDMQCKVCSLLYTVCYIIITWCNYSLRPVTAGKPEHFNGSSDKGRCLQGRFPIEGCCEHSPIHLDSKRGGGGCCHKAESLAHKDVLKPGNGSPVALHLNIMWRSAGFMVVLERRLRWPKGWSRSSAQTAPWWALLHNGRVCGSPRTCY